MLQKSIEEKKNPAICGKRLFAPLLGLFGTQVELVFLFPSSGGATLIAILLLSKGVPFQPQREARKGHQPNFGLLVSLRSEDMAWHDMI
jgi:hypothetical protein